MNTPLEDFAKAMDAFLKLPVEEGARRLEVAARRAREISDRFDQAISFATEEDRRFLRMPMTTSSLAEAIHAND